MRFALVSLALVALLLPGPAAGETIELAAAGTSASLDTGEINTDGLALSVQLCGGSAGNAVSGTFTVSQGNRTGKLASLWTATLTTQDGCSAASFVSIPGPALWTKITFTRTAGTYGAWLHTAKR